MNKDPPGQIIMLPDGRGLGCAEYGDLKDMPEFHFYELPGWRLEGFRLTNAYLLSVRLIVTKWK